MHTSKKVRSSIEQSRRIVDLDRAIGDLDGAQFFVQSLLIGLIAGIGFSAVFFVPIALAFPVAVVTGKTFWSAGDHHLVIQWVLSSLVCGSIASAVLLSFLSFVRTWQLGHFGKAFGRRSIQLPQSFDEACDLVGFSLAELDGYEILLADVESGHLLLELQQSEFATNYLTVNLCSLANGGTLVNITGAPALHGRAKLFSSFYFDRGVNSDNVDALMSFLKPFARLEDLNLKPRPVKVVISYDPEVRDLFAPPSSVSLKANGRLPASSY